MPINVPNSSKKVGSNESKSKPIRTYGNEPAPQRPKSAPKSPGRDSITGLNKKGQ
jgi:hypothetical protein